MMVFPMIGFRATLPYLLLFVVFWIAGYFFDKWLKKSLRNGPKYGRPRPPKVSASRPVTYVRDVTCRSVHPGASPNPRPVPRPAPSQSPETSRPSSSSSATLDRLYSRLLTVCVGDAAKAERLIGYELQRNGRLSREQAIQAALDRLYEDRR